jgi:tetratricopeptide (TPR) repeat protein
MNPLRRGVIFILLLSGLVLPTAGFAWEWKALHESADTMDLSGALARVRGDPASLKDLYILALVYLSAHKNSEAGEIFDRIIKLDSAVFEARWGQAEVLRRLHKLDEGEKILDGVIKAHPDFSPACITLAYIRYLKMDFEQSAGLAYKVIKQGRENVDLSNYTRAYLIYAGSKGMIAHYGGPLSKAVNGTAVYPNLKKAQALQPDSPQVFFGLGAFYFLAPALIGGDLNKAMVFFNRTVEADPLFADAYVRIAQLYKVKRDKKKYDSYLKKALEIDPGNELAIDVKNGTCRFICIGGK